MRAVRKDVAIIFGLVLSQTAWASSLENETSIGKDTLYELISYEGASSGYNNDDLGAFWNLAGENDRIRSTTPVTKTVVTDRTQSVTGGAGWQQHDLRFGGDLSYSRTLEEGLNSYGPDAYLGYTFGNDSKGDEFKPSFDLKVKAGVQRYVQDFTTPPRASETDRRLGRASIALQQANSGINGTWSALSWLSLSGGYTSYSYNRNVPRFASFLDSSRAAARGVSGLASTIVGFPSNSTEGEIILTPGVWTIDFDAINARSAVDDSLGRTRKLVVSREFGDWDIGIGAQRDDSPLLNDKMAIVDIAYNF